MDFHGIVDHWNDDRAFGFIELLPDRRRVFVHVTAIKPAGLDSLRKGQRVEVHIGAAPDGRPRVTRLALTADQPASPRARRDDRVWVHEGIII
jgi:cold shock protein